MILSISSLPRISTRPSIYLSIHLSIHSIHSIYSIYPFVYLFYLYFTLYLLLNSPIIQSRKGLHKSLPAPQQDVVVCKLPNMGLTPVRKVQQSCYIEIWVSTYWWSYWPVGRALDRILCNMYLQYILCIYKWTIWLCKYKFIYIHIWIYKYIYII